MTNCAVFCTVRVVPNYAKVICTCGAAHVVDRDEDGALEFVTRKCADQFCGRDVCESQQAMCADCDAIICREHAIELRGRVYCRPCAAEEMADQKNLAQVQCAVSQVLPESSEAYEVLR